MVWRLRCFQTFSTNHRWIGSRLQYSVSYEAVIAVFLHNRGTGVVWSSFTAEDGSNGWGLPVLLVATWTRNDFGLARRVRLSLPASARHSFSALRLNTVLTHGISFRFPQRRPTILSAAFGSVPCSSGHATAYQRRSLLRVRRLRASSPQGSYGCWFFRHHHGPINVRLSFPTPTIGMKWACANHEHRMIQSCTAYLCFVRFRNQNTVWNHHNDSICEKSDSELISGARLASTCAASTSSSNSHEGVTSASPKRSQSNYLVSYYCRSTTRYLHTVTDWFHTVTDLSARTRKAW